MKNTAVFLNNVRKINVLAKKFPLISALIKTNAWKRFRHKITLRTSPRQNCHFTSFLRMPTQFEALSGPVLDFLFKESTVNPIRVTIIGCSTGAEAFTIASVLRSRHPELAFSISAYDIDKG